jgi:hypothetical protein
MMGKLAFHIIFDILQVFSTFLFLILVSMMDYISWIKNIDYGFYNIVNHGNTNNLIDVYGYV